MFEQLRRILVSSFVGSIALGWVFAQGILHFAYVFSAPVVGWLMRREYPGVMERTATHVGFSLSDAIPELARSFSLLIMGYLLLQWLYYRPSEHTKAASELNTP